MSSSTALAWPTSSSLSTLITTHCLSGWPGSLSSFPSRFLGSGLESNVWVIALSTVFIWSTQVLGPGHAGKLALTVQSKHESDGSACVHTKSIQLQAKQANATRCYQPPSASRASVESKRRMWRRRWPIWGCNRPRARRTPPWLDLGLLICKHWRCAHPKIESKLWAMLRLRKAHSPCPPPRGLSFSRLSRACCGNCCRSALPHLASHRALFARYRLLIRIVCSGHEGPRTSLSHRETKHLSALLCTTTDGEANAHVLSAVIQLQNNGRASVTGPASSPPCIGVRTAGHQRGLRMLKAMAIGKVSGQKDACHMTSHDMLIGDWVQREDFNGFLLWSRNIPKPQLGRIMEVAVRFATSTGLCEVQGILPHLPVTAAWGWSESATARI